MSHFARRVGVTNRQETLGLLATAERRAQLTPINSSGCAEPKGGHFGEKKE